MGNKPRAVTIEAYKDSSGKIAFEMLEKGKKGQTLTFNKTKDNMKKGDNYDLQFKLVNKDGLKLEFLQDMQDVMWVAKGTASAPPACPQSQSGDPEFTVTAVCADTLDVTNTDMDVCKFKFALNFIDTANSNHAERFDPIYDNQNGGFTKRNNMATAAIIGGVAAAGLIVLLVAMERNGWLR